MKQKQTEAEEKGVQRQILDKESAPEAGHQATTPEAQFDTRPYAQLWQAQRAFGNRYTQKLLQNNPPIQARFKGGPQNHRSEPEVNPIDTQPIQKKENRTGLPDNLKTSIENLSGYSLDDVTVHYNSNKPAQLQAHAYAQGTDIHLAAGQEKHLPHEAWHMVQQKNGQVRPTIQANGLAINDDSGLEREADTMGKIIVRQARLLDNKSLTNSSKVEGPIVRQQPNHYVAWPSRNTPMQFKVKAEKLNIVGEEHIESNLRRKKEKLHAKKLFPEQKKHYWLEHQFRLEETKNQADLGAFADSKAFVFEMGAFANPEAITGANVPSQSPQDDKGYGDPFHLRIRSHLFIIDKELGILQGFFNSKNASLAQFLETSQKAYRFVKSLMKTFHMEDIKVWDAPLKDMYEWLKTYSEETIIREWTDEIRRLHYQKMIDYRKVIIYPLLHDYGVVIKGVIRHKSEIDKLTLARSEHMISTANGSQKVGIWKVGDVHAKQIKNGETKVKPDEQHVEVTLQAEYDQQLKNEVVENEGEHNNNL